MVQEFIQEWYVQIDGHTKGPLSILDMRKEWQITPDTLVWKEGFTEWRPIRQVPELKTLFEDPPAKKPIAPIIEPLKKQPITTEEVLTVNFPPPYLITGLIVIAILLIFFLLNN